MTNVDLFIHKGFDELFVTCTTCFVLHFYTDILPNPRFSPTGINLHEIMEVLKLYFRGKST